MKFILTLTLLFFALISCRKLPVYVHNYKYASVPDCDCMVHANLAVGSINQYVYKRSAYCSRGNYRQIQNYIDSLNNEQNRLYESNHSYEDEFVDSCAHLDSLMDAAKSEWTHCKIRVKEKITYLGKDRDSTVKLKVKIKYYNKNKFLFKRSGKEKFKNGVLL